jgi:hypothetical protein
MFTVTVTRQRLEGESGNSEIGGSKRPACWALSQYPGSLKQRGNVPRINLLFVQNCPAVMAATSRIDCTCEVSFAESCFVLMYLPILHNENQV